MDSHLSVFEFSPLELVGENHVDPLWGKEGLCGPLSGFRAPSGAPGTLW